MTRLITFAFCFFLCANLSFAQGNVHFPVDDAVWSVYEQKYVIKGDSLYNSHIYQKYYIDQDSIIYPDSGTFYALVREDSTTGRIYSKTMYSNPYDEQERLLYDFSLGVNDTVTVYPCSFWFGMCPLYGVTVKVTDVDSVSYGGQYRKRLKIEGYYTTNFLTEYWIEGIGSTLGPFFAGLSGVVIFDVTYPVLLCFENNGQLIYHDASFTGCWYPNPVGIPEGDNRDRVCVYPNPVNDLLFIESKEEITNCRIYSLLGQLILQEAGISFSRSLDLSVLLPGNYFIIFVTKQGIITKKLIVKK